MAAMELKQWLDAVPGRSVKLAAALTVYPSFVSKIANGTKRVPLEQCVPIEQFTEQQVTCEEMRPDVDWAYLRNSRPELAQAQAEHAPVATEYIAASTAALEKLEHAAEDQIAQLVTEARVDIKHIAGAVVSELLTAQRTVRGGAWDGIDRRTKGWDGTERRKGPDRRQPDVLEAPETVTPLAAKEA